MKKQTFFVSVNKGNYFGPEEEQDNPLLCITVNYYSSRFSNYRWTEGIVYYKEHIFYIDELSENYKKIEGISALFFKGS